ncbi:hypothetical protein GUJ93_ZPchr0007g3026 [Zizania palustris]|uniref:Uncharacterized protein n=1 Tax=Zizania palustris TaxID=103762 RepID=A0A8J5THZ8_ZIZPA|nr:hypothetical protein GUJ93_ZPchr0007g3026 [Zizania palustris]
MERLDVCVSQEGDTISTFTLFRDMQHDVLGIELRLTEHTFGSLIRATYLSPCTLGLLDQLFVRVLKFGCSIDLYVDSALVSAFARHDMLDEAKTIFINLKERNAVTLNGLIVGLVKQQYGEVAAEIFLGIKDFVVVNLDTYVVFLSAIAEFSTAEEELSKGHEEDVIG